MWTIAGLMVAVIGAVHCSSYVLWLWNHGERKAAVGAALLTIVSMSLPVYAAVASNV